MIQNQMTVIDTLKLYGAVSISVLTILTSGFVGWDALNDRVLTSELNNKNLQERVSELKKVQKDREKTIDLKIEKVQISTEKKLDKLNEQVRSLNSDINNRMNSMEITLTKIWTKYRDEKK